MKVNNTLAKALYDNKAESPDELAFRRGDILTVLEQNVLGSEGWWKCSLHGKQGLVPANRLQLLTPSQLPCTQHDFQGLSANPQIIYQVPSAVLKAPPPLSIYEKMDGWTKTPPPSSASSPPQQEVYEVPALAAKVLSEKPQHSSHQHLITLPRATWASALKSKSDTYDVPSPQRCVSLFTQGLATPPSSRKGSKQFPFAECCLEKALQLYDTPLSPEKARTHKRQESPEGNVYDIPPTASREFGTATETAHQGKHLNYYNTMPNLRKSEWIYDIPVSPEKMGLRQNHYPAKHFLYDIPSARFDSGMQINPLIHNKSVNSQVYDVPPVLRKISAPEIPLYDVPSTHDALLQHQNDNYIVPLGIPSSRIEKESYQTLYDIPKGTPIASPEKKGVENHNSEDNTYVFPLHVTRDGKLDQDRLSVSSTDSRTSTISTSSSSSTEFFQFTASSSPSSTPLLSREPTPKEATMELDSAIETLTKLQHSVSSSIASLMIFVSSKWRYQEHLKENIEEIRRAVDHIKVSLGEFLDFARTVEGNAAYVSDSKLQARIKKQLNSLIDSFQRLVKTREALNACNWSLEVLVIKSPQDNLDDLDRYVMVARTIPDDIKKFVSIIIANGKLLFRKNSKEKDGHERRIGVEHKMKKDSSEQRIGDDSLVRNVLDKPRENSTYLEKSGVDIPDDCDNVQLQKSLGLGQAQRSPSASKMERKNVELKIKGSPPTVKHNSLSKQDSAQKVVLSDLCRLYFGAVQRAIGVFHKSLSDDQSPEVFIAQSKLIIMVGQKLVDALCQEALEKATRNEILCGSSQFCGLLKNLAVATKNAAMQYPKPEAIRELQDQADGLSKYIQQFQAMME
ncbi:cas scaffolding protein family member 4 isoform X2 [Hemicordylus capensis]|uniref:cas scaffolding protein family member 4 isoform X2 n=1 Tax=Hemicordylus capensis TaxID=884348 RepID=UPI0023028ACE|nr:cas scaffolding protein family member 4 isoform X2 [Hemicordylus capensis]